MDDVTNVVAQVVSTMRRRIPAAVRRANARLADVQPEVLSPMWATDVPVEIVARQDVQLVVKT